MARPIVVIVAAAIATAAGYGVAHLVEPSQSSSTVESATLSVLPPNPSDAPYYRESLGVRNGELVVGEEPVGGPCRVATLDPATLRTVSSKRIACDDPGLYGETAMPVTSVVPSTQAQLGEVRIAVHEPGGRVQLGPVVMRFGNFSSSRPEWTYGGGYLWLYDVGLNGDAALPRLPSEVLQISPETGRVLSAATTPMLARVILATDDDGLWIATSDETGSALGQPIPPMLYFLQRGSSRLKVIDRRPLAANWLVASGHTAWVNVATGPRTTSEIETYATPSRAPRVIEEKTSVLPIDVGQAPADAAPILDAPLGLVTTSPGYFGAATLTERVFLLDPGSGHLQLVASIATAAPEDLQGDLAFGGSLYLLAEEDTDKAMLFRVALN